MTALILTVGLTSPCIQKLNTRFKSPLYKTLHCAKRSRVLDLITKQVPQLIVIGPQGQSFEARLQLCRLIRSYHLRLPIILVNRGRSEWQTICTLKAGANACFQSPLRHASLFQSMEQLLLALGVALDTDIARPLVADKDIIGHGQTMRQIKKYLLKVAGTNSTVLITGETGTGKELIAKAIHKNSPRTDHPMVCVNCAAIPENLVESELFGYQKGAFTGATATQKGKFALAHHGTLFMDEIGEMSLYAQAKILRCLENNEIFPLGASKCTPLDIRIITATNRDPDALVDQGKFRPDLYYRLNVAHIHIPPLRERREDIPDLVAMGIGHLNQNMGRSIRNISDEAMAALLQYPYPGNVRELNNLLESAFIHCESKRIEFCDFPKTFIKKINFSDSGITSEKDRLILALADAYWNKSKAARNLKWSRMRIYRSMKRYNIATPHTTPK